MEQPEKLKNTQLVKTFHAFYCVQKSLPLDLVLNQVNQIHIPTFYFLTVHFSNIVPFSSRSTRNLLKFLNYAYYF